MPNLTLNECQMIALALNQCQHFGIEPIQFGRWFNHVSLALNQCPINFGVGSMPTYFYLALDLEFGVESMPKYFLACFGVGSGFLALGNDLFWRWISAFGVGRKRPMPKVGIGESLGGPSPGPSRGPSPGPSPGPSLFSLVGQWALFTRFGPPLEFLIFECRLPHHSESMQMSLQQQ